MIRKAFVLGLTTALCAIVLIRPAATEVVNIPDANLRAAINETLNKKSEAAAITKSEMQSLTELSVETREISDLIGLEHATNLTHLHLDYHKGKTRERIVDVSPLANLAQLTELSLPNNHVSDVSPLAGLKSLRILDLRDNDISDISPLTHLTQLTELDLAFNNTISDVSHLENLRNLEALDLASNTISDVSHLENLKNLKTLTLNHNSVSDISSLVGLAHLKLLECWKNPLSADSLNIYIPQLRKNGTRVYEHNPRLYDDLN